MDHLSTPDRGIASAWSVTAGLVVAGVWVHRLDVAAAAAFLFTATWLALAVVRARRRGAGERAARRAERVDNLERATAEWERRRAAVRLENVPGLPDDAGVIAGPDPEAFRALMRDAGAGDLERKTS